MLGREHPDTITSVNDLGFLYYVQGRNDEAEPLYKRALAACELLLGPEHPATLTSVNNLAALHKSQGRYSEAEPLYQRTLAARERVLGPEHPDTLTSVNNLAVLYYVQGRYGEAEPLYKRALAVRERVLGPDHPDTITSVSNLAALCFAQADRIHAAQFWRRSTATVAARTQRGVLDVGQTVTGMKKSEAERLSWQFWGLVKVAYRLTPEGGTPDAAVLRETFQMAQWAISSGAAQSLAQMAARGAKGDPALSALARERQDLVAEWQKRELFRNAALGRETAMRETKDEAHNNNRMASIDTRITQIDHRRLAEFSEYAALASPTPLSVDEVQSQLRADDALGPVENQDSHFKRTVIQASKRSLRWIDSF